MKNKIMTKFKNTVKLDGKKSISKSGLFYGLMVGLIFGIIPIFSFLNKPATLSSNQALFGGVPSVYQGAVNFISRGAAVSVFNDAGTLIFTLLALLIIGGLANVKKVYALLKTKAGLYAAIGGFFGGPIGNTLFFAVFALINGSFGSLFFALEPLIVGIVAFFIFKRSYNRKVWIALSIIVVSIFGLVLAQIFGSGGNFGNSAATIALGSLFGVLAVSAYATESILADRAMSLNKIEGLEGLHFLQVKAISSTLLGLLVVVPLTSIWLGSTSSVALVNTGASHAVQLGFWGIADMFSLNAANGASLNLAAGGTITLIPFVMALIHMFLLFFGRIAFYRGIEKTGAGVTNTLFQTSIVVTPVVVGLFLVFGFAPFKVSLYNLPWWSQLIFWILALTTLVAAMYVSLVKPPINRLREKKLLNEKSSPVKT